MRLGVNIDHVATLRNARGGIHPDPITPKVADNVADRLRRAATTSILWFPNFRR